MSVILVGMLSGLATGMTGGMAGAAPVPAVLARPAPAKPAGAKANAAPSGYPRTPPAQICGSSALLSGPATQPPGSVVVDVNTNLETATQAAPPGTTFWLTPGVHTFGTGQFDQAIPKDNNVYIGAPGAILDGQGLNLFAFTQHAIGVTIEYLTIQNFASPGNEAAVNHDSGANWLIQFNSIQDNNTVGLNVGSNGVVRYNCVTRNGQSGINGLTGVSNVTIDHNELSFNETGPHALDKSCGCTGGMKVFGVTNAAITNNWIHDNKTAGIWADTNAIGYLIQGNYINNNDDEAIFFETSYNAFISNNNILNNAIVKGRILNAHNDTFPQAAVYISESGGDRRLFGGKYSTFEISGNNFDGNWGGVTLWEDANRFCNSVGNTAPGFCPIAGVATVDTCVQGTISKAPYVSDCRWKTQNVFVHDNTFRIDTDALGCTNTRCGENAMFSQTGSTPTWSPYLGDTVQKAITFNQNNHFQNNKYIGNWNFDVFSQGYQVNWDTWRAAPYNQDSFSTLTSLPTANALDSDTATLEGSIGHWSPWFSTTIAQSTAQSHTGTHSLQVNVTAGGGWGVQLNNFPYFPAHVGAKVLNFWGMSSSGSGLAATMQVTWRDGSGAVIQTDNVTIPALTSTWRQGFLLSNAPAGTVYVGLALVNSTGVNGNTIYLDDMTVADNAVDTDTATLEGTAGSTGHWAPWFSANIAQSTAQAHSGTHSLQVGITAPNGWGVTLNNYPYFPETAGTKSLSFWARAGSGTSLMATMQATWLDAYGNVLQTDKVSTGTLTSTWQQAFTVVTAPPGTEYVGLDLVNGSGAAGNSLFLDDLLVVNGALSALSPPPPPSTNALDADTATLEGSLGHWAAWFNATAAQSTAQAHGGTHSLAIGLTVGGAWGVTLNNWPGFAATAGSKTLGFWAKTTSSSSLGATMQVTFRNASGGVLQTNTVTIPALSATWTQGTAVVNAPAGTAFVGVDLVNSSGVAGSTVFVDDIRVG
ncbi:MAG: right-handed parallel beta-helix repeat-containing protein [Actinomycetota bacterium]|nr:right-handed parallel beta-helix repeat-containing protein [Actinomycetota bacterium]MDQ6945032.1 right-handed parallel beta-helix repeat-containing protein [Actinomycetota bacterium]